MIEAYPRDTLSNRVALKVEVVENLWKLKSKLRMKSFEMTFGLGLICNLSGLGLVAGSNYIYPSHMTTVITIAFPLRRELYSNVL